MIRVIFKLGQEVGHFEEKETHPAIMPLQEEKHRMGRWAKKKIDAHWNSNDINRTNIDKDEQAIVRPVDILQ